MKQIGSKVKNQYALYFFMIIGIVGLIGALCGVYTNDSHIIIMGIFNLFIGGCWTMALIDKIYKTNGYSGNDYNFIETDSYFLVAVEMKDMNLIFIGTFFSEKAIRMIKNKEDLTLILNYYSFDPNLKLPKDCYMELGLEKVKCIFKIPNSPKIDK